MLPKYNLDFLINVDKITASAWGNLGANTAPGSSPGFRQPTIRLYNTDLMNQRAFEFWLAGVIDDNSRKNFMMTVILTGDAGKAFIPQQRWKSADDSIPLDRWFYGSTTWDGSTGKESNTVRHNGDFYTYVPRKLEPREPVFQYRVTKQTIERFCSPP